jgi:hypothetical protein
MTDVVHSQFSFQRVTSAINAAIAAKQDTLVSGTNIRSINGNSLLGSGDLAISTSTAPLVLGTNLVQQRNGTNGQIAQWFKTYTSATNAEWCEIDAAGNASNFDIAACIGSAGGVARGIRIGGKNAAGAFTPWLSFATNGEITVANQIVFGTGVLITNAIIRPAFSTSVTLGSSFGTSLDNFANLHMRGTARVGFGNQAAISSPAADVVEINNGTSGTLRDFSIRDLISVPSASRTLATNGQFTIERVSNTECNLVYRGNDGVTRRSSLTFS